MNQEKIGKFIAKCRNKKDLTQEELADKLGITDKAISKWENGRCLPDLSLIKPLCEELDISMNELINGDYIKDGEIKEKSEMNLDKTITYIKKKEKINKKRLYIISGIIVLLVAIFGLYVINKIKHQTYYTLENSNIMYEEHLNNIKKYMDEICEKDENDNWIKIKTSSGDIKYDQKRNELVQDINESYKYLRGNKDINLINNYQIKGHVSKKELEYLNTIKNNLTSLNNFSKYKSMWSSEDEVDKNIYEKVKYIYSVQGIPLYNKEKLTFAELNTKLLFEAGTIEHLSVILYGEYRREELKIVE